MNAPNEARWSRRWWILPLLCLLVALTTILAGPVSAENLVLGWLYFPLRNIGQMTVDGPSLGLGIICCATLVIALHWMLRRRNVIAEGRGGEAPSAWRWSSTCALSGLVALAFVVGIALVGGAHHLIWLAQRARVATPSSTRDQRVERNLGVLDAGRTSARSFSFVMELRFLEIGVAHYGDLYGELPPGGTMSPEGVLLHGWMGHLTRGPFLQNHSANGELDFSKPWDQPPNARIYQCAIPGLLNPDLGEPIFDSRGFGMAHFAANSRLFPIVTVRPAPADPNQTAWRQANPRGAANESQELPPSHANRLRPPRHASPPKNSQAILVGSIGGHARPWGHPANLRDPRRGLGTAADQFGGPRHWRGAYVLAVDGSVRFLSNDTDPRVLESLAE